MTAHTYIYLGPSKGKESGRAFSLPLLLVWWWLTMKDSSRAALSHLDLYLNTRGKLELHQSVDRLGRRRVDVEDTLEGAELELLAGLLVNEGRAVYRKNLLVRGQGYRTANDGARALYGLNDLLGRLVDEVVIERL